jgi:MoxR-like ATPase
MVAQVAAVRDVGQRVRENVARVMVGLDRTIELMLVALLCEGHVLLEDVPGVGKTTLAKALARSLGCSFHRLQFTPDLSPSDITGMSVYNQQTQTFEFHPGPIFAQIVLADEINRAGPRTQSALLEAMQERQVTADGVTRPLARPFLVLATQNPIELEGTFPLPEAQLDRFVMRLKLGYPEQGAERTILRRFRERDPLEDLGAVLAVQDVISLATICKQVYVHEAIEDYMIALAQATRVSADLALGVSPRGTLSLYHTSQALAALRGRSYVLPDDVQAMVEPVLAHRLVPSTRQRLHGHTVSDVLQELLAQIPVPVEENWAEDVTK